MKGGRLRIIAWGGLGDILLSTPTIRALKEENPKRKIIIFCPMKVDFEVYRNNPYIDELRSTKFLYNFFYYILYLGKFTKFYRFNYGMLSPAKFYHKNAIEIIAEMADVRLKEKKMQVFLTESEKSFGKKIMGQFKNPVIIHVTSRTSKNQHWPLSYWKELITRFPEIDFVQVGLTKEKFIEGAIDQRGKTVRESLAMLKYARSFVGVVSFYSHATNAFGIPGVVMMGPSTPWVWGHENNINLFDSQLPCIGCVDDLGKIPCPYQTECMRNITVNHVAKAIIKQMKLSS